MRRKALNGCWLAVFNPVVLFGWIVGGGGETERKLNKKPKLLTHCLTTAISLLGVSLYVQNTMPDFPLSSHIIQNVVPAFSHF
jgi:hypothetical protein